MFWRQRSKQLWLQSGDKNTKFFHASASTRRRNNQINRLKDEEGKWVEWERGLPELICNHFRNLFTAEPTIREEIIECVPQTITDIQNVELQKPVTADEVKNAIFSMHPDKAPGPDGMTPAFYQKHRSIVGNDVVNMTSRFFQEGVIEPSLNETNIVLIPKKKNPVTVGDLRPISLCNVLMKVITKVLSN